MIELANTSCTSSAAPQRFFSRWIDHSTWPQWSPDTEWVTVDGPVRAGAHGTLKPQGGPKVKFTVAECVEDRVYTDVSRLPGAKLTFQHTVEPVDEGSRLAVRVWLDGPMAWLWARTLGRGFRTSAPADLKRLVALAESE